MIYSVLQQRFYWPKWKKALKQWQSVKVRQALAKDRHWRIPIVTLSVSILPLTTFTETPTSIYLHVTTWLPIWHKAFWLLFPPPRLYFFLISRLFLSTSLFILFNTHTNKQAHTHTHKLFFLCFINIFTYFSPLPWKATGYGCVCLAVRFEYFSHSEIHFLFECLQLKNYILIFTYLLRIVSSSFL